MLEVFLGEQRVGSIVREENSDVFAFVLDDTYGDMPLRPVLGQQFEDRRQHRVFRQTGHPGRLPTFFANLLPEGALRSMISAQINSDDDATKLEFVGEDLPGAVIIRPAAVAAKLPLGAKRYDELLPRVAPAEDGLRFSLAGMQLKFSAVESAEDRFTLPFRGLGGRWILKFGSSVFEGLPENEFALMGWARACGLNVPEHRLVSARAVTGLDENFSRSGRMSLPSAATTVSRTGAGCIRRISPRYEAFRQIRIQPSTRALVWMAWRDSWVICAVRRISLSTCGA